MKITADTPMGVVALARLGYEEVKRLALAGELTKDIMAVAADGAQEYLKAMASGDVASPELARMRVGSQASGCAHCPSMRITPSDIEVDGGHLFKLWCGKFGKPDMGSPRPTCGCLVGVKINGAAYPGPKVWVGSEKCPQGLW